MPGRPCTAEAQRRLDPASVHVDGHTDIGCAVGWTKPDYARLLMVFQPRLIVLPFTLR